MQCVDVAGLQKYAMAQADTKCSNAGAAKRQERCVCVAKIASAGAGIKNMRKKLRNCDVTARYPVGSLT